MITTVAYNEYTVHVIMDLLKKYSAGEHTIKGHIVSKPVEDVRDFVLSFEVCKVIFNVPEDETAFLLKLSSEDLVQHIDISSFIDKGFEL